MKITLKLEYLALLFLSIYLFSLLGYSWWLYPLLFFLPDIGMMGYLVNTKIGAFTYNILHHQGVAVGLYLVGIFFTNPLLMLAGVVMLGHANFDRFVDYGLKYSDSFHHTHLGNLK